MKKLILLTIGISLLLGSCTSNKEEDIKKNDWTERELKGEVKSIYETSYLEKRFGEFEKGLNIKQSFHFNRDGYIEEEINYDSDRSITNKTFYVYDGKYNNTEQNTYSSDSILISKTIYKYTYDEKGNIQDKSIYLTDGRLSKKEVYKYDNIGNLIEENIYDSYGILTAKKTFKYDGKKNKIKEIEYDSNEKIDSEAVIKYDKLGNVIELEGYSISNDFTGNFIYEYEYDEIGNWIRKKAYTNEIEDYLITREIKYYD